MSYDIMTKGNTAVSVVTTKKAVDVRRSMVKRKEILDALCVADRRILAASAKKLICEMTDEELINAIASVFRLVAADVGYKITDKELWQQTLSRIYTMLKAYYQQLSMTEVSLAFELFVVGELDKYLPQRNGEVDKNHYQQFSPMYVNTVLNAYVQRQRDAVAKAYEVKVDKPQEPTEDIEKMGRNYIRAKFIRAFLYYKYHGKIQFEGADDMFYYSLSRKLGYADEVVETDADKQKAFGIYMSRYYRGLVNRFDAYNVRKEGAKSDRIAHLATIEARKAEVKRAFTRMVNNEVIITNIVRYEF